MHRYRVTENIRITPTVAQITMQASDPSEALSFAAGQYAGMSFRRFGRKTPVRTFSILSSPGDPATLQFAMRIGGNYTKAVTTIKSGDTVEVMGPFGNFGAAPTTAHQYFLAGGIGITPFISMLRAATEAGLTSPITLVYSSQTQNDVPFAQELVNLAARNPNLTVIFAITSGDIKRFKSVNGISGRITADLLDKVTGRNYSQSEFYICGPAGFMGAMTQILDDNGVSPHRITTEAFSQTKGGSAQGMTRRVYGLTAATMLLAAAGVTVIDLHMTSEKAQAYNDAAAALDASTIATPNPTPTATPATSDQATTTVSTPAPTTTPAPVTRVTRYQQPSQVS